MRRDPLPDERVGQAAARYDVLTVARGVRSVLQIEPQLPLARRRIRPMALETMLRQNGPDLFQIADGPYLVGLRSSGLVVPASAPRGKQRDYRRQAQGDADTCEARNVDGRTHGTSRSGETA